MTRTPGFENLVELCERSVAGFAGRPLFGTKVGSSWRWMTYREFGDLVGAVRGGLAGLGVVKDDRVAIISNNRPEWAIAAYATYGLGAAYVAMYEAQLDKEWQYILDDCGAKVLFVAGTQTADRISAMRQSVGRSMPRLEHVVVLSGGAGEGAISWNALVERGRENPRPACQPDAHDTAGFIYTSGTTGNPKGVLLSHGNLASNVTAMHEVFPMTPDDRSLSFLPWAHSFGYTVELHALISMGASLGIAESVEKIVDNLAEVQPTLLFSVPRIFNRIYDGLHKRMADEHGLKKRLMVAAFKNAERRRRLLEQRKSSGVVDLKHKVFDRLVFSKVRARFGGKLRYAFSGGAALSKEVAEFIDNLGILVYEGYGLTETSPIATANWPGARKIGSVGKPIPGVRVEIDRGVTGDAENGEIVVYGPNVMQGYHNLPDENAKVFTPDGGFRTGDLGCKDEDGYVFITGRIKEQYKLENGKYVAPAPLEEHIKLSPFISNVMLYGDNKPYNVAVIVSDMGVLGGWARDNGVGVTAEGDLLGDARVRELYQRELDKSSAGFKQFEKVRRFVLTGEDFTTLNDMLTPTLKVKRRVVMQKYGTELDALYGSAT